MINISRLWNDGKFKQLSNNAKLLYIYLSTSPSITNVGTVCLSPDSVCDQMNIQMHVFRRITQELVDNQYIYVKSFDDLIYFIVPSHFSTVSNSDLSIEKIKSDLASVPPQLKKFLNSVGISPDKKFKKFNKPTPDEVEAYGIEQGYILDGKEFCEYYDRISKSRGKTTIWVDSNGKQIKDWRMKALRVWCKPQNKLKKTENAPKGFEYFYVRVDGKLYFPDSWKDGKPSSKDYSIKRELLKKFEQLNNK